MRAGARKILRLTPDHAVLKANGQDLSAITAEVLDEKGVIVQSASNMVRFAVSGPGVTAGVDNGDPASSELFQADQRSVFEGRALLVVRSRREAGAITVKAVADGVEPASVELPSK